MSSLLPSATPVSNRVPKKHVPKHRAVSTRTRSRAVRRTVAMTSVAAVSTGLAVAAGLVQAPLADEVAPMAAGGIANAAEKPIAAGEPVLSDDEVAERRTTVSRNDNRSERDDAKAAALTTGEAPAATFSEDLSDADPRTIAKALLPEYGFSASEFGCLDSLYVSESDWDMHADNPTSSAYGIPQALTETHDMPAGYFDSAEVQIRWGLDYIRDAYGSPCNAWSFKQGNNWY